MTRLSTTKDLKFRRPRKTCECPPVGEGTLAEIIHDDTCVLRLSKAEREAYDDLVRKEERASQRMTAADVDYEQANINDPTWVYLNLK